MSFSFILLGVVVLVVCVTVVVRRRRSTHQTARKSTPDEFPVPTFKVVSLGLQGSGKTLLLTSIYRTLQVPSDRSYYLKAPYDQLIELNRWYRETADSQTDWPEGTTRGEMREYEFSVVAHLSETPETVLKLGYLEYPGELLTDRDAPGSTAQARLLAAIDSAHALVGIIDGLMILRAYRGDPRGRVTLQSTLDSMIHSMLATRSPIVFVITKWDLLDGVEADEDRRLRLVRDFLMTTVQGFRELVHVHTQWRIVRLIPVTAVGHDFAVLKDGEVRKLPEGRYEPANVEAVLSSVVPDVLRQVELSLDRATRERILAEAQRRLSMGPREALRSLSKFVAERAGRALVAAMGGGLLGEAGMALFLDSRARPDNGYSTAMANLSAADRRADEVVRARRQVMYELERQVVRLENSLPASRLNGGV